MLIESLKRMCLSTEIHSSVFRMKGKRRTANLPWKWKTENPGLGEVKRGDEGVDRYVKFSNPVVG